MERLKVLIKHAGSNPYKCCNTASFLSESQINSPKQTENGNVHIYIYMREREIEAEFTTLPHKQSYWLKQKKESKTLQTTQVKNIWFDRIVWVLKLKRFGLFLSQVKTIPLKLITQLQKKSNYLWLKCSKAIWTLKAPWFLWMPLCCRPSHLSAVCVSDWLGVL